MNCQVSEVVHTHCWRQWTSSRILIDYREVNDLSTHYLQPIYKRANVLFDEINHTRLAEVMKKRKKSTFVSLIDHLN